MKLISYHLLLLIVAAFSFIVGMCAAEEITSFSFGGSSQGSAVSSSASYPSTSQGSLSSTAALTPAGEDTTLVESSTSSNLIPIDPEWSNAYGTVRGIYLFDPSDTDHIDISTWSVSYPYKGISVSNTYKILDTITYGFISIEAENPKGYKAKVTTELKDAQAGELSHDATATLTGVSAHQKLTGLKAKETIRTLSANNIGEGIYPQKSSYKTLTTTFSGDSIPALNYDDKASATKSSVTLTATGGITVPKLPQIPSIPSFGGITWPAKEGYPGL